MPNQSLQIESSSHSQSSRKDKVLDRVRNAQKSTTIVSLDGPIDLGRLHGCYSVQSPYVGQSPIKAFISQASTEINSLQGAFLQEVAHLNIEDSLTGLSDAFFAADSEDAAAIRTQIKNFRRRQEVFFIPEREMGLQLIQIFIDWMDRARPLFEPLSHKFLEKIAFDPSKIQERGWLLIFNSVLSSSIVSKDMQDTKVNRGLMWNTLIVLEDPIIVSKPSELNIHALILVASHSQEVSTPEFCWILISQACRMAQAVALHLPTTTAPIGLHYFPRNLYEHVPPPSQVQLTSSKYHNVISAEVLSNITSRDFLITYFPHLRSLAILQGKIQSTIYVEGGLSATTLGKFEGGVDSWMDSIRKSLSIYKFVSMCSESRDIVRMSVNSLKFQYHYLIVFLTRWDHEKKAKCLFSAKSALGLVRNLVSSSLQVLNGIVWESLYQPFMPYFVIFGNILSNPHSSDRFEDLQLLRQLVLYFLQMHNNHRLARKLEKIADGFTRFVETYVRYSMRHPREVQRTDQSASGVLIGSSTNFEMQAHPGGPQRSPMSISTKPCMSAPTEVPSTPYVTSFYPQTLSQFNSDSLDSDSITLFDIFSSSSFGNSVVIDSMSKNDADLLHPNDHIRDEGDTGPWPFLNNHLCQELESMEQNFNIVSAFDCYSWEPDDRNGS
ncbi:hypothetical protein F5884DRAFT_856835 [Xylogone sp. PMI_703]|nr:hypothetical protein F5884DRAFT_856835 [Xylogone sp. PMI_703]